MEEFKIFTHDRSRTIGILDKEGSWVCELSKDNHYYEHSEINQHAKLICEAFNVVTRTGLTPEQMEKRISDLEARLKEAVELIQVSDSIVDDLMLGLPGIRSQIELSDLRKRFDPFLKEKTK